jgi:hypothetical protein
MEDLRIEGRFFLVWYSVDGSILLWENAGQVHNWRIPRNGNYLSVRETGSILKWPSVNCTWSIDDAACRKVEEEGADHHSAPSSFMQTGFVWKVID